MRIIIKPGGAILIALAFAGLLVVISMMRSAKERKVVSADAVVPSSAVIASYSFEEQDGTTTADTSGHNHTANFQGNVARAAGVGGGHCLSLTGQNGVSVEIPETLVDTTKSYSVTACVKLNDTKGFQTVVSVDGNQVSGFYLQLRNDSNLFGFSVLPADDPGKNTPAIAASHDKPEAGKWYHLAGIYDADAKTLSLYVNGKLENTVPCTTSWKAQGHTAIGRGWFDGHPVDYVNGLIDNVGLYNRALTADEVKALAHAALPDAVAEAEPAAPAAPAGPPTLKVDVAAAGTPMSPHFYGLMTEEISHSYDGGLYGEMIQNRTFQDDPQSTAHWSIVQTGGGEGTIVLDHNSPLSAALPTSLRLDVKSAGGGQRVGVANDGFWGMGVKPKTTYRASFYARAGPGFSGPLTIAIESKDGKTIYAQASVPQITPNWQKYSIPLTTGDITPSQDNRAVLYAGSPGTVYLNLVSLFPPTYRGRPNGNRVDLMEKLAALKHTFLRLPGGNYLEGDTIAERFAWKNTLHGLTDRPGHRGPWGYRSSDGMGLLEFLEWCEDLNMEPVLGVYAGYSLHGERATGEVLKTYVQEALEEIEYVTGNRSTKWGAIRARDGHPAPFPLHFVEIGNEDQFDKSGSYEERFTAFYDAIRAKYPRLKIIATMQVRNRKPDVRDDHYYRSPQQFLQDAGHYDNVDRHGPKVFVGEWASQEGKPTPNLDAALGDAGWLTGLERNADLVIMEAYAPLLVHVGNGASQWPTNLIGYDAQKSYGSPSYYVQVMFGANHGDHIVPTTLTGDDQIFQSVTRNSRDGTLYIKLVNPSSVQKSIRVDLAGAGAVEPTGTRIVLSGANPTDTNTIEDPEHIVPVTTKLSDLKPTFDNDLPPYSVTVLKVRLK